MSDTYVDAGNGHTLVSRSAHSKLVLQACQVFSEPLLQAPSMAPPSLLLIKQIRPRTAQIDNLRTTVPVLFESRALEAVEGVADAFAAAHDAFVLVVAEAAFVADAHHGRGTDVAVAYGAFAVAFVAETAQGDAGRLATHY